jgi:hypothetical protein
VVGCSYVVVKDYDKESQIKDCLGRVLQMQEIKKVFGLLKKKDEECLRHISCLRHKDRKEEKKAKNPLDISRGGRRDKASQGCCGSHVDTI